MVQLPEPRPQWIRRLAILAIAALVALIYAYWSRRAADERIVALCRDRYRLARTPADTAAADTDRPLISRGNVATAPSCGTLRSRGKL